MVHISDRHLAWVNLWSDNKEGTDGAAAQERQECREEESLKISRQANNFAKGSLYFASGALPVSAIALIVD